MIPSDFSLASIDSLGDLYNKIKSSKDNYVAIDTETDGVRWIIHRAFGVAVAWDDQYIFLRNEDYGKENVAEFLNDLYLLDNKTIVMHNAEFDLHIIRETYGVDILPLHLIDALRVAHILDTAADHSLKGWGTYVYGPSVSINEDILKTYKDAYKPKSYAQIPRTILDPYACMDVALTKCLCEAFVESARAMSPKWFTYEHALIPIVMQISRNGILLDFEYMHSLRKELKRKLFNLQQEMFEVAGTLIKPGSSDSIADFMYNESIDGFDLKSIGGKVKAKGTADVDMLKSLMGDLSGDNPRAAKIAQLILEWRKFNKQLTTYVEKMEADSINGRIYADFNALGTRTGRFSGSNPNMQNIPRDKTIKRLFRPDEEFYEFDYSQLEYRLAGVRSSERKIMEAYINGIDFHSVTASGLFGVPVDQVNKEQRDVGKTINFLTLYGGSAKSLALKADVPLADAKIYHAKYWDNYPSLKGYIDDCMRDAETNRYVYTMFGRKVPIFNLWYAAPNYEIQGTGGDMIKISLIRVNEIIKGTGAKIRNTVHDSIFLDEFEPSMVRQVKEAMEAYNFSSEELGLDMPIEVGITTYKDNWGDGYEWSAQERELGRRLEV